MVYAVNEHVITNGSCVRECSCFCALRFFDSPGS